MSEFEIVAYRKSLSDVKGHYTYSNVKIDEDYKGLVDLDQANNVVERYKQEIKHWMGLYNQSNRYSILKDISIETLETQISLKQERIEELEFLLERVSEVSKKYLRHMKNTEQQNQELIKENESLTDKLAEISKRR